MARTILVLRYSGEREREKGLRLVVIVEV